MRFNAHPPPLGRVYTMSTCATPSLVPDLGCDALLLSSTHYLWTHNALYCPVLIPKIKRLLYHVPAPNKQSHLHKRTNCVHKYSEHDILALHSDSNHVRSHFTPVRFVQSASSQRYVREGMGQVESEYKSSCEAYCVIFD